ncbi:hypothetical protein LTR70_002552 [Exophiala xenobiotica]|uniref:Heterokaryon incompatibility domain-containing protein n=1 Tax=Lithohypha guttulata TaxID=1690604 RepID=A0ABR0KK00_9EURO|nr:hypothetical protein LTR24_001769 [Lithohypha guttulata]KAK5325386.1 hypothetical protein LTR70_002552 [Exophiala xenobiotica]
MAAGQGEQSTEGLYLQIRQIYEQDLKQPRHVSYQYEEHEVSWEKFRVHNDVANGVLIVHNQATRDRLVEEKCDEMYVAVCGVEDHFVKLDLIFSSLLSCEWRPNGLATEDVVQETFGYLHRGLQKPMELPSFSKSLHELYFVDGDVRWDKLQVVSRLSSNTTRLHLYYLFARRSRTRVDYLMQETLNGVGELIDIVGTKERRTSSLLEKQRWFIVRSFLWAFWQRCRIFYTFTRFMKDIRSGADHEDEHIAWLRNFAVSETVSLRSLTVAASVVNKPSNMCSWALELLRSDLSCQGLSFDLFHQRYTALMGHITARCSRDGISVCDGLHSDNCLRYKGLAVRDQSMHDCRCDWRADIQVAEPKLRWSEESYRAVKGARAVKIDSDGNVGENSLEYCSVSSDTIAISHVWSHGQGGRPETGINLCLHERFSSVARSLGCTAYWLDTACIPTDHVLRREAVEQINEVFHQSRAVLVCDKDLMTIDVSVESIELYESILCAMLMCDWNTRAWTILEGLKGRKNILILCKENRVLGFRTVLQAVAMHGKMEIIAFARQLLHLLPWREAWRDDQPFTLARRYEGVPWVMQGDNPHTFTVAKRPRTLPIEIVGSWLSHRPASRPGDEMVIWSLLPGRGTKPIYHARDFWRQQDHVRTGFLISSADRLKQRGLSWAPSGPYALSIKHDDKGAPRYHRPTPAPETNLAFIDRRGISAQWDVYEFGVDFMASFKRMQTHSPTYLEINKITAKYMRKGRLGAVLQTIKGDSYHGTRTVSLSESDTSKYRLTSLLYS